MNRNTALRIVNPLLALAFFGQLLTVFLKVAVLERGGNFPAIDPASWAKIHGLLGILILVLGIVHLALNWNWVVATMRRRPAGS